MDDFPPPAIFKSDLGKPGWSAADVARQAASLVALGVDWGQTRTMAKDPSHYKEVNPITSRLIGEHPSTGQVNNYFLTKAVGDALLANSLPPGLRAIFQYGNMGLEANSGRKNFKLGVGMTF
jgi:hypothetical protein